MGRVAELLLMVRSVHVVVVVGDRCVAAAAVPVVNERLLQRTLRGLVQLVVELGRRVGVLVEGFVRRGRVASEWQGRSVPYLGSLKGSIIASVPSWLLLMLLRRGQEVPWQRLRLTSNIVARESAAHIPDRIDSRRGLRLVVQ